MTTNIYSYIEEDETLRFFSKEIDEKYNMIPLLKNTEIMIEAIQNHLILSLKNFYNLYEEKTEELTHQIEDGERVEIKEMSNDYICKRILKDQFVGLDLFRVLLGGLGDIFELSDNDIMKHKHYIDLEDDVKDFYIEYFTNLFDSNFDSDSDLD